MVDQILQPNNYESIDILEKLKNLPNKDVWILKIANFGSMLAFAAWGYELIKKGDVSGFLDLELIGISLVTGVGGLISLFERLENTK